MTAAVRIDGVAFSILGPLGATTADPHVPDPEAPCTQGLNFGGGDLEGYCPVEKQPSAEQCRALCGRTAGCVGFIYDTCPNTAPGCNRSQTFPAPRCWLKAKMTGAGSAESCGCAGFMGRPNPPPLHSGGGGSSTEGGACPKDYAIPPLPQLSPPYILPTRTVYTFAGKGVAVNLTFASPKFMERLDSFVPVALVQVSAASTDGQSHEVDVFFEATGQLAVDDDSQNVSWARVNLINDTSSVQSMKIFHSAGVPLTESGDAADVNEGHRQPTEHLDWGAVHLVPVAASSSWMGSSNVARASFAKSGQLPAIDESVMPLPACMGTQPGTKGLGQCGCGGGGTGAQNDWPTLAASWKLSVAGNTSQHAQALLASDDLGSSGRYFGTVMGEYWRHGGQVTFESVVANATEHFDDVMEQCVRFDSTLVEEMVLAGGVEYATVGALSYRQVLGDNTVMLYPGTATAPATPFMFVKGLGSSGGYSAERSLCFVTQFAVIIIVAIMHCFSRCIAQYTVYTIRDLLAGAGDTGTIDDNYPAALFYMWRNPELLNALLQPINYYMRNFSYCPTCVARLSLALNSPTTLLSLRR